MLKTKLKWVKKVIPSFAFTGYYRPKSTILNSRMLSGARFVRGNTHSVIKKNVKTISALNTKIILCFHEKIQC